MQELTDNSFQQERYLKSIQESLLSYQEPLLEYLSTRSSNAMGQLLIDSQNLRNRIPAEMPLSRDPALLKERTVYSLIQSYLDLADTAAEEKRGRNISRLHTPVRRDDRASWTTSMQRSTPSAPSASATSWTATASS
jgi:two-component system, sensor histidine kinase YesM